jgi:hypothetical protein
LLDEARPSKRRASERRHRVVGTLAEESVSLHGAMLDLADRGTDALIRTTDGHTQHGTIRLVGIDFVILGTDAGDTWVTATGIDSVRPLVDQGRATVPGDRSGVELELVDALARVASEQPRVAVRTSGGESILGALRAVGSDVLILDLEGLERPVCYVSLRSLLAVVFLRSG